MLFWNQALNTFVNQINTVLRKHFHLKIRTVRKNINSWDNEKIVGGIRREKHFSLELLGNDHYIKSLLFFLY